MRNASLIIAPRLSSIDVMRGIAVVLMVVYHLIFDLSHFGYFDIDMNAELHWRLFRFLIVGLFLFAVGISFNLAHVDRLNIKSFCKRTAMLGGMSLVVSVGSYTQFPETWIYFGVLHFILFASFICLPLRKRPMLSLLIALFCLVGFAENILHTQWLFNALKPILNLPNISEDLVPLFPWLGIVLLGLYVSHYQLHRPSTWSDAVPDDSFGETDQIRCAWLLWLGKHSLLVYMTHQPLLFGVLLLLQ